MRKYMFIPIIMALIFACNPLTEVSKMSVGKIIDANVISTSWNEGLKTQIKTKTHFIVVYGIPHIIIGSQAYMITFNDDSTWLIWDGGTKRYRIC